MNEREGWPAEPFFSPKDQKERKKGRTREGEPLFFQGECGGVGGGLEGGLVEGVLVGELPALT